MTDEITEKEEEIIAAETAGVEERLSESGVLTPELIAEVKKQVTAEIVEELKEKEAYEEKERQIRQEQEDLERLKYVAMMKESDEPWVDFVGNVRDMKEGQRLEMDWNDAFIKYLRDNGIDGVDDEQVVQKYISLLLRDMTDQFEDRYANDSDFQ
jgi:hypothetical protein